jgi:hypothetical protein
MNKVEIMNKVSRTVNRAGLKLKKHSPEILVVTGIVGFVGTAVLAYKAAPKVNVILEDAKENIDAIHRVAENPAEGKEYAEEDVKQALTVTYAKTALELVKTCAPVIGAGVLSTTAILAGHNILRKRYVATAASYMVLDKNFKEYRNRVIDRFGKELDKELRFNIKTKEIEETVVNEDGSETIVKKTVEEADPNALGDYVRIFDEWCRGYEKNQPELNLMFLKRVLNHANEKLQAEGHLFLNDVFQMLGFDKTPIGQVVGWIYDPSNPNIDSYVSFGNIFDLNNSNKRDFINGREPAIILEFNCDGPIFELI